MKLSDVKQGQTVFVDGGFTCMDAGPKVVQQDEHGLFISCTSGHHYLDGQEDTDGELIGIHGLAS